MMKINIDKNNKEVKDSLVRTISESNHHIDNDDIAKYIYNTMKENKSLNGTAFIDFEVKWDILYCTLGKYLEKFNNFNKGKSLLICFSRDKGKTQCSSYNKENNSITFNLMNIKKIFEDRHISSNYWFSLIMHEISHYIDLNLRTKNDVRSYFSLNSDAFSTSKQFVDVANRILYLFSPTEIQARLNEYYYGLKYGLLSKNDSIDSNKSDNVLLGNEMLGHIVSLENETDSYSIVLELLLAAKLHVKRLKNNPKYIQDTDFIWNDKEFEDQKQSLLRLYKKRLSSMERKAESIRKKFD